MTRMKRDRRDWLVPIHCVNHRLELAIKDSFDKSPFSAVDKLYITLFNLFKNSAAIKSDLYQAAEVLEISVYTLKTYGYTVCLALQTSIYSFIRYVACNCYCIKKYVDSL